MRKKRSESGTKRYSRWSDAREKIVRFDVIEYSVAGCGCDWMSLVSKSVFEGSAAAFKSFHDICRDEHGPEWSIAARNSLPDENNVRFDAPVLHSERLAGAAHAAHDFICDKENAARTANLGNARDVTFRRHDRAKRCSHNRLENESGGGACVVIGKKRIQVIGAGELALRKCFVKRAVIAKTWSDVAPFCEQRSIRRAASDVAANGHRAKRAPVIALAARKNAVASGLPLFNMILADEFDRRFCCFGASRSEVNPTTFSKIWRRHRE
jgi:hypothetical protein